MINRSPLLVPGCLSTRTYSVTEANNMKTIQYTVRWNDGRRITVSPLRHAEVSENGARMRDSRGERGLTLIELLVALVLSSILIFVLYKTFIRQHKTYTVQEQVFDVQQNARAMMARMVREIRMAGFGRIAGEHVPGVGYISRILPVQFRNTNGTVISYPNVLNRDQPSAGWLTIVTAVNSASLSAHLIGSSSRYEITVDRVNYEPNRAIFDEDNKRYISIDGVESNAITDIREETVDGKTRYRLTLQHPLEYNHRAECPRLSDHRRQFSNPREGGAWRIQATDRGKHKRVDLRILYHERGSDCQR